MTIFVPETMDVVKFSSCVTRHIPPFFEMKTGDLLELSMYLTFLIPNNNFEAYIENGISHWFWNGNFDNDDTRTLIYLGQQVKHRLQDAMDSNKDYYYKMMVCGPLRQEIFWIHRVALHKSILEKRVSFIEHKSSYVDACSNNQNLTTQFNHLSSKLRINSISNMV